jgi:hypothetical protein
VKTFERIALALLVAVQACSSSSGAGAGGEGGPPSSDTDAGPSDAASRTKTPDARLLTDGGLPDTAANDTGSSHANLFACSQVAQSAAPTCWAFTNLPPDQLAQQQQQCATQGGIVVADCPSANLVGCCAGPPSAGEQNIDCFYVGEAAGYQQTCESEGGTWSTSPP